MVIQLFCNSGRHSLFCKTRQKMSSCQHHPHPSTTDLAQKLFTISEFLSVRLSEVALSLFHPPLTCDDVLKHVNSVYDFFSADPASGITMDFFKGVAGVKHTATPELRGNSFIVAKAQIQLSYNEVWNGLLTLFNELS
jgi:hypothetical protein